MKRTKGTRTAFQLTMTSFVGAVIMCMCSCQKAPKVSQAFQSQVMKVLEDGTKLNAATSEGVSLRDYNEMLNEANGAIELCFTMWPESFDPEAKSHLQEALKAWNFTKELWVDKIKQPDQADASYEAGLFLGLALGAYGETTDKFRAAFPIELWQKNGEAWPIINHNKLGACLAFASAEFESARKKLLETLN